MRNLKKLFAVIMVVAMLASIMVPAFAADYEADALKLKALGLFKGYSDTDLGLDDSLTREQGLTFMLRARGLEDEVQAMSTEEIAAQLAKVTDLDTVSEWAKPYVAYAVKNGLTKGIDASILPNIKFAGQLLLTGKEFINFMLNAMGYEEEWDNVLSKAADIGMLSAGQAVTFGSILELKRDTAAGIISFAMSGTTASGVSLAQALVDAGAVDAAAMAEAGYFTPTVAPTEAPEELAVEDYYADNLKEMVLVFNRPLNKDTVKVDNIKVKKAGVSVSGYTVSLKDDLQTVVIKAADGVAFENQVVYAVTLKGIKDADAIAIKETTLDIKPFDATLPEVVDVKVTGPKNLEITFSEPIKDLGTRSITLKSGTTTVGVNNTFAGYDSNVIKVTLYSSLTDGKSYTLTAKGFEDYAGYKMINYSGEFAYVADKSDIIASIDKAEQTYVVVTFNKPVTGITKDFFYHTFSAWKPIEVYSDSAMTTAVTGAVDKVWVKFAEGDTGYAIPEGTAKLVIRDKVDSAKIKDNWGNEFLGAELSVTVSADKTAPEVTELKKKSETALSITFSEEVKFAKGNVEVLNDDGSALSGLTITVEGSGKSYTINLGKNLSGKSVLVNIKNVEDKALAPNKMALYSAVIDITDSTAPSVTNVTYKNFGGEKALFIFFNEAVDETALVKDNYYILSLDDDGNSVWTKFGNTPEFYDGNKVVRIELNDTILETITKTGTKVIAKDIKDLAGNALAVQEFAAIKAYDDVANAPEVTKAEAIATNKVVLTFSQFLTEVDAAVFTVNGDEPTGMEISENSDGNTVITLTTKDDKKFAHDLSGTPSVGITITAEKKLNNVFGVNAKTTVPAIADKIKPEVKKDGITALDLNGDGKLDNIRIEFAETIKFNYISATTFTVDGYTIEDAYPASATVGDAVYNGRGSAAVDTDTKYVMIRVTQPKTANTTATPKVKVVTEIRDVKGNKYDLEKDAIASVDGIAPIVVTKLPAADTFEANATHTLVFSEAINEASRTEVKAAVDAAYTKNGTATVTSAWGTDNKTLTVTITADATNTVVLSAIADIAVTDLKDNTSVALDIQQ